MGNFSFVLKHDTSTIPFAPQNAGQVIITKKRNINEGQIFFRSTVNNLVIGGSTYDFILNLRNTNNCLPITIEIFSCGTNLVYTGYINVRKAIYNYANCTVTVKLETADKYECFLANYDKVYNVYEIPTTTLDPKDPLNGNTYVGFDVQSVISSIMSKMPCVTTALPYNNIKSDFFEWNPEGDAPNYVTGDNYVYGGLNQYHFLAFVHTSEITNYPAANPATIMNMSLKDIFQLFRNVFNVYWDLRDDGTLVLEHILFFYYVPALSIPSTQKELSYSKDIFTSEYFKMNLMETQDWIGVAIFNTECMNGGELNNDCLNFTTDYVAAVGNINATDEELGLTMLLTCFGISPAIITTSSTILTGLPEINEPLSRSRLQQRFLIYYLNNQANVIINGSLTPPLYPYITTVTEVTQIKICCDTGKLEIVITDNSAKYLNGALGIVLGIEMNLKASIATLLIGYGM